MVYSQKAEEGDSAAATEFRVYDEHEAIMCCIELSPSILREAPELDYKIVLIEILESLRDLMSYLVIVRPNTAIGLYFYFSDRPDAKAGIYEFFPLRDINFKHMKQLNDFLENIQHNRAALCEYFHYDEEKKISLERLFSFIQDQFIMDRPNWRKFTLKRVFLFTDCDTPLEASNPEARSRIRRIISDMDDLHINFVPFFISSTAIPFNNGFYSDILRLDTKNVPGGLEFDGPNTIPINATILRERIMRRKTLKRTAFQCPLILDQESEFVIGIRGYHVFGNEKPGSRYKLVYEREDVRQEAYSRKKYFNPLTGEEIDPKDIRKMYKLGDLEIDLNDEDIRNFKEAAETGYNSFLKLLSFRSSEKCLKYFHVIESALFIVPDEAAFEGSIRTLSSLYRTMKMKGKTAIVWGKLKRNSNPGLFTLSPSRDDDRNEGFYLQRIPFLDEIRKVPRLFYPKITSSNRDDYENLKRVTRTIIGYLNLRKGYVPSEYPNPGLHKFYKTLRDYLLQVDSTKTKDDPDSSPTSILDEDGTLEKVLHVREKILASANSDDPNLQRLSKYIRVWCDMYKKYQSETVMLEDNPPKKTKRV